MVYAYDVATMTAKRCPYTASTKALGVCLTTEKLSVPKGMGFDRVVVSAMSVTFLFGTTGNVDEPTNFTIYGFTTGVRGQLAFKQLTDIDALSMVSIRDQLLVIKEEKVFTVYYPSLDLYLNIDASSAGITVGQQTKVQITANFVGATEAQTRTITFMVINDIANYA